MISWEKLWAFIYIYLWWLFLYFIYTLLMDDTIRFAYTIYIICNDKMCFCVCRLHNIFFLCIIKAITEENKFWNFLCRHTHIDSSTVQLFHILNRYMFVMLYPHHHGPESFVVSSPVIEKKWKKLKKTKKKQTTEWDFSLHTYDMFNKFLVW